MECVFCGKFCKSKISLVQHSIRCKFNPNKIKLTSSFGMLGKKGSNQYIKAKNEGRVYVLSDSARENISNSLRGHKWPEARRLKHSERMRQAVLEHPESYSSNNVCGRVKHIEFNGTVYKGSWEVRIAKIMTELHIDFIYEPTTPFEYNWNGGRHLYFPDFYISRLKLYLEIKGFRRERDICKWASVPNLKIIDRSLIFSLNKENFLEFCKCDISQIRPPN